MYKYIFITSLSLVSLFADSTHYTLEKDLKNEAVYLVKVGAYSDYKNALKIKNDIDFDATVVHLNRYYNILSEEFKSKEEADNQLKKIRQNHKDAYVITLYKEAEVEYAQNFIPKQEPKNIQSLVVDSYEEGIKFYDNGLYEDALASFDRALIDNENDLNYRFHYAKTLYQLALYKEAKIEFEKLVNKSLTRSNQVTEYLDAIDLKIQRHFFNSYVGIGVGYDDNINLITDSKYTQYGKLVLENETKKSTSTFAHTSLSFLHMYKADSFNILSSFYNYNEIFHSENGNDLNFLDLQTTISKRYKSFILSFPVGVNTSYLDNEHIGYNIYTSPYIRYYFNNNFSTLVGVKFLDNKSKYMVGKDYKMSKLNIGLFHKLGDIKYTIFGAYEQYSAKDEVRFDVDKDVVNGTLQSYYSFNKNYMGVSFYYAKESFNSLDEVMGYKREDDISKFSIYFGRDISSKITAMLSYTHTQNSSNVNVYSYDKNSYIVDCKYKF